MLEEQDETFTRVSAPPPISWSILGRAQSLLLGQQRRRRAKRKAGRIRKLKLGTTDLEGCQADVQNTNKSQRVCE